MKIFTYAFNRPDYLEYQSKCLRAFIQEPFEFYCIDNARDEKYSVQFQEICQKNNIIYRKNLQPDHSEAGKSHYSALQWSWNNIIEHTNEIIVIMDHDTFPMIKCSITELLGDAVLAGPPQARGHIEYFHPSLMIFDTSKMSDKHSVNFMGTVIDNIATDIGGEIAVYMRNHPELKKKYLRAGHIAMEDEFFQNEVSKYGYDHLLKISQLLLEKIENKFLHSRNGSNYSGWTKETMENKDKFIFDVLDRKING